MNILFANYGDFSSNSLNHIAGFAAGLRELGHDCIVAVPRGKDTLRFVPQPRFHAALFAEVLDGQVGFENGKPAAIVHAWTPRESVRRFVLACQRRAPARVIVHLEDNEDHLFAARHGLRSAELLKLAESELSPLVDEVLIHPRRARQFLRTSHGATLIVPTLAEKLPPALPHITLFPGVSADLFGPLPDAAAARAALGISTARHVIAYPGSSNFANEQEMRDLYAAVALLNEGGQPVTLLRTGFDSDVFLASVPPDHLRHVIHLGFVEKAKIPLVLAAAELLVQPGDAGEYNDLRLPSKVPEFLASGRPVVLPRSNVGRLLRHQVEAWILADGRPGTLAAACASLLADPGLRAALGAAAQAFAREHFNPARQCAALEAFYGRILAAPARPGQLDSLHDAETEVTLSLRQLAAALPHEAADSDLAAHAAELVPLVEHLERPEAAQLERERLERERDSWRTHFDNAREHLRNVEAQLRASEEHASHLTAQAAAKDTRIADLEKTAAATAIHVQNLDAIITTLRGEIASGLERERDAQQRLAATEREIGTLQSGMRELEGARDAALAQVVQLSERAARLSFTIHELKLEVQRRNAKIQTLETSFSWRITQPLRWLRRRFVDTRRRRLTDAAPSPLAPDLAPPAPACSPPGLFGLPHSVDEPRGWTLSPRTYLLRGWVFHPDGNELRGIRALVNGRTVEGVYGFKRLDVAASVRGQPQAEFCGWRLDVEFRESDTTLELQTLDESGIWLPFFRTGVRVGHDLGPTDLSRYEEWIRVYDTVSEETLAAQRSRAETLVRPVTISVVTPVFNTPEPWLTRAIASVREQSYPHWELCLANDASTEPHVREILDAAAASDRRIKVVHREANGHISAASNAALALATGEFVALLDHDDELAPHALHEIALALEKSPDAILVYSDEDKVDQDGRRFEPYFKPDWNPDLFLGQNYLSHLSVYRTSAVREAGGFREGYEGSQDWDLALRVTERARPEQIVHVPRVLYHWRAIAGSTALQLAEKSYPVEAARRALADRLARLNIHASLEPVPGDHWRTVYALPEPAPLVSIIIPTRNGLEHVKLCVESILERTDYHPFEIIIVDNQSDDPATLAWLRAVASERVRILNYPHRFNYSAINNAAVREARGTVVALLNNDLEVITRGWLTEMVSQACRDEIGCVGAMLYYPNDAIQHAGVVLGVGGVAGHAFRDFPRGTEGVFNRARLVQNYSAVTAACLVVRKALYERVGGLDEADLAVAFNDIDFCLKLRRAGYWNLWTPFAEFYHHESASRGADDTPEKKSRFEREIEIMLRRWGPDLAVDPAYNPNLTLERNDFSLAIPPRKPPPAGPRGGARSQLDRQTGRATPVAASP